MLRLAKSGKVVSKLSDDRSEFANLFGANEPNNRNTSQRMRLCPEGLQNGFFKLDK